MWDALNRRPIIQILDHIAEYDEFQISGGTASFLSDSFVKVTFKTEAEKVFLINAYGREVNTPIDATDISNLEVLSQVPTILEKEPDYSHTISIRHKLWERGQAALERVKNAFNSPATERILAIEDSVWLESSNNLEAVLSIEAPPALSPSVDTSTTHSTRPLYAAQNTSNNSKKHEKTPIALDKSFYFYVADTKGRLTSIGKESFKPQKRGTLGKRVASKAAHCSSLYAYRTNELAFLLSTDGYLHRILVGTFLGESQYADILRNGGLLLQSSALTSPGSSLVCLTSDGGLISVSINSLAGSFPAQGLPVMKKELATSGKTIVAACICPANTDVLLVTKKGHALRIKHSKMSVHKSLFLTPTKGIKLMDGDEPAACCPFTAQGVLGVSAHGQALRISGEVSIPAQNPGSSGVAFMKLDPGDSILDVLDSSTRFIAMIREDGYLCCISLDSFSAQGGNSKGVRAMVTRSNSERHPIVAAISL